MKMLKINMKMIFIVMNEIWGLTHYRPAMPFGNRKKRGFFQFSIGTI